MTNSEDSRSFPRALVAEALGTGLLVMGVVGSGIMAERLTRDVALALLCNAAATAALLFVLILIFAPLSGAQFNPAVTLSKCLAREMGVRRALPFMVAQIAGGLAGVALAHLMFGLAPWSTGLAVRSGPALWLAEAVATAGLLLTIAGGARHGTVVTAAAVGPLHRGSLLVHRLDVLRQPGRDPRPDPHTDLFRHRAGGRTGLPAQPIRRSGSGNTLQPLAFPALGSCCPVSRPAKTFTPCTKGTSQAARRTLLSEH